jgi:cysteine-rich repeat protein
MRRVPRAVIAVLSALLTSAAARAEDVTTKKLIVKDNADPAKRQVSVLSTDLGVQLSEADDPGANGAAVHVYSATDDLCVVLGPGANWTNTGTKWKYKNPISKNRALIGDSKLKVKLKGVTYTLADDGTQGTVNAQVQFGTGTRYCMQCPGNTKDDENKFIGKNCALTTCAPEPSPCEPGTTTTSTTTPGSTTSTTVSASCGNGTLEGSEECDDGGTSGGDGCDATCNLESTNPALCAGVPTVSGTNLDAQLIATDLEAPVHIAGPRLDPSRVFIVEQPGRIQIVKNGVQLGTAFLAIEGIVQYSPGGEEGLLSVAFDPDYETNRFFYVYYTNNSGNLAISRFTANAGNPDDALEGSEHNIITIPHPGAGNHNGGQVAFGPDGFLYAATGDGGGGGDPNENAQNDASQLGKLLRIDVDTDTVQIWGKGLRNPYRFSFDRGTGDLYIGDVGQGSWEEIDHDPAPVNSGVNYGWDDMEGRHCFEPGSGCLTAGRTLPVLEYCNSGCGTPACSVAACSVFQVEKGQAVAAGFVYRGCTLPDLHGEFFYSDPYNTWIKTFEGVSGGNAQNVTDRSSQLGAHSVTGFGEDARGELYFTDYGSGEAYKIVPQ